MAPDRSDSSLFAYAGPAKTRRIATAWKKNLRTIAALATRIVISGSVIGLVVLFAWKYPEWLGIARSMPDAKERFAIEEELFKTLIQILGGVFLLSGLYFTWRNTYLTKEGQITDRFNKAIDHLGSDKPAVRLGGIYALARIAKDSPKDHWPIMEVLCAFLRARSSDALDSVSTEVQAVVNVLGARCAEYESVDQCLDLRRINLRHANLRGALLNRAQFEESNLEGADLMRASLVAADCRGACFKGAHMREATLDGANFVAADLTAASLREASLRSCNILVTRFDGTVLIGADLSHAQFATKDQLASAICDKTTRMPSLLEPGTRAPNEHNAENSFLSGVSHPDQTPLGDGSKANSSVPGMKLPDPNGTVGST